MLKPKILWTGPIDPAEVFIKVQETKRKTNKEIESLIKSKWDEISKRSMEKGLMLYDGNSYRLESFSFDKNKGLNLFVSKFKYSVRRPLVEIREVAISYGEDYCSKGLAIGGLVKTKDGKYIFGLRSGKTLAGNNVDFIGGVLDEIELKTGADLIKKNKLELIEELAIDSLTIKKIDILGMILSNTTNIIIITNTELNLTSEELLKNFKYSDDEMSSLDFIEKKDLEKYLLNLGGYKIEVVKILRTHNFLN